MKTIAGAIEMTITAILFIVAKITLSNLASLATILSACVVITVNTPKLFEVWERFIKPKIKRTK